MSKVRVLGVLFAVVFAMVALVGCSDSSTKSSSKIGDSRLVGTWELKAGDDVITTITIKDDGTFSMTGTASATIETRNDNEIWANGVKMFDYAISANGNTLTLAGVDYTKKAGTGSGDGDKGDGNLTGGTLTLPEGQGWTTSLEGYEFGYIFKAGGSLSVAFKMGVWMSLDDAGTWSATGNKITITVLDEDDPDDIDIMTGTYGVSGDKLTIKFDDGEPTMVFTKTSGIIALDFDFDF
ncbi:MAG: hypothetical protein FWE57_05960 [Chitinispirillia bacterium]|nr:hypothetical protein [Chitinispirillia bacterium]